MTPMTRISLITLALTAFAGAALAEENNVVIPDPEIEPPAAYVERKLADFRARLDALKKQRGAAPADDFDSAATAEALFKSLAGKGPKDLVVNREGDESVFDLEPFESEYPVFVARIGEIRLVSPFGGVSRAGARVAARVAVDEDTAAAFSLPPAVSPRVPGTIVEVQPDGECCTRHEERADGSQGQCLQSAPAFKLVGQNIDLRRVMSGPSAIGSVELENIGGDVEGRRWAPASTGPGKATFTFQTTTPEFVSCGLVYNASKARNERVSKLIAVTASGEPKEASIPMVGVRFGAFGLPGLDVSNAGEAPQLDFFDKGRTTIGSLTMGDGTMAEMPAPVASYFDADGQKFDGLRAFAGVLSVETAGIGPVLALGRGEITMAPGGQPGASEVTWTLNDAFQAKHSVTLNRVSVEIKGLGDNGALLLGRDYETTVTIDGPVDFDDAALDIVWGGEVQWASANGAVDRSGGKTLITNRFRPAGELRPVIEIAMTSPFGEVFAYDAGLIVRGRAIGGLDLRVVRGEVLSAITDAPVGQVDTFFPSTFPSNPAKLSAQASFITDEGDLVSLQRALSQASAPGLRPESLIASSNEGVVKRTRFSLSAPASFEVAPRIGAALIESKAGEGGALARALSGGSATAIAADPVVVTSNSLRLLRQNGGFTLTVRGQADMGRYRARWTRRGFGPTETAFEAGEDGFTATFETRERLAKVEIVEGEKVLATMLGVMATLPAQIRILPFRKVAEVVDKTAVEDFGQLAALKQDCLASGASRENCAGERNQAKSDLKERREGQKDQNRFLQELDRAGKALVELADQMEVAAAVQGAPLPELGETVCVWSIIGGAAPLKVAQRVTRLRREAAGDFCFNIVNGVKAGFTPGAEIRVELTLLDNGAGASPVRTE